MDRLLRKARSKGDAPRPRGLPSHQIWHHSEAPKCVNRIAGHRGEREGNRKTIAQGMPVETGEPMEDYPHFVRTTGASDTRHSLRPLLGGSRCALLLLGRNEFAELGRSESREREVVSVMIARSCGLQAV